jgi:hypothetical protein
MGSFESISLLQLGQVIFNVLIRPLNSRFWQWGQKYQHDMFTVDLRLPLHVLFMAFL